MKLLSFATRFVEIITMDYEEENVCYFQDHQALNYKTHQIKHCIRYTREELWNAMQNWEDYKVEEEHRFLIELREREDIEVIFNSQVQS